MPAFDGGLHLQSIAGEPSGKDAEVIREGMLAHHAASGHPRNEDVFSILLRDTEDKVLGAVIGSCLFGRMHIRTLWVDEGIRSSGWGRKLMETAESEAVRRGCTHAYTDTFSWQAPDFYKKLGYQEVGALEDYPPGENLKYLSKRLMDRSSNAVDQRAIQ